MSRRIVFMGTPDFAVESLRSLLSAEFDIVGVITAPDRKSGRGQQVSMSAVKKYALEQDLHIMQPENLKDESFIQELKDLNAELFVVVAFRMLPEVVWGMPSLGTINLHGSLLPQYRGAAPINWAVINGEDVSGATTFFIEREIDTGKIIDQCEIKLTENTTAGELHDQMMVEGAAMLAETCKKIFEGTAEGRDQLEGIDESSLRPAPKIFKPDCKIDWSDSTRNIHNKIRGLSPYPTAWTTIQLGESTKSIKLFLSEAEVNGNNNTGQIKAEGDVLRFGCSDGWLIIKELQLEGKKRMPAGDFLRGTNIENASLL